MTRGLTFTASFTLMAATFAPAAAGNETDTLFARGIELARSRNWEGARQSFLLGHQLAPNQPRFLFELGAIAFREKNYEEAKRYLHRGLSIARADTYGNDLLAHVYFLEGNLDAALRYWNRIDKPRVRHVRMESPELAPALLERAVNIEDSTILSADQLRTTRANLDRLDVFSTYKVQLIAREQQQFDVSVDFIEKNAGTNGWFGRIARVASGLPYQMINIDVDNIGSSATNLRSMFRWDPDKRRVSASLSGPFGSMPEWRYTIGGDARDEIWDVQSLYTSSSGIGDSFRMRKASMDVSIEYGLSGRFSWTNTASLSYRSFLNAPVANPSFKNGPALEQSSSVRYRLIDNPERRLSLDTTGAIQDGVMLDSGLYSQFRGGLAFKWDLARRPQDIVLKSSLDATTSLGQVPFDEYFMLGMERDTDTRLWMRGHVGTRDGRKGNAPMGTRYALLSTDLKKTIYSGGAIRWSAGPTLDVGRISDSAGRFGSNGWLVDVGIENEWRFLGGTSFVLVCGRDLRNGSNVVYTAIRR